MATDAIRRSTPLSEVEYPDSDGEPIAENTRQFRWIVTIKGGLDVLFRDEPDVFVAGDLLWYPIEGDNTTRTAPDAMVAFGRPKGDRGSYMQWAEDNVPPQVVFEVLSPGNRAGELARKFHFYDRFGVEEYYVYDPDRGTLKGWRRVDGRLGEIGPMAGWVSPRLGVRFELIGGELELYAPDGRRFATYEELDQQRDQAERQAQRAERQAERAKRQAERAKRQTEQAKRQTEQEKRQTEQAKRQAEQAKQQAEQAKQQAERLAAQLRALGIEPVADDPAHGDEET